MFFLEGFTGEFELHKTSQSATWDDVDFILMAAGTGSRMKSGVPKQWLTLCGRPLFLFVAERLISFGATSVIIVARSDELAQMEESIASARLPFCRVTAGGKDRQESVWFGMQLATRHYAAVHDAARPFVEKADVEAALQEVCKCDAVTLGHPVRDSLKRTDAFGVICETIDRRNTWQVQTPQVFRLDLLCKAHELARHDGFEGTDDTVLVERIGHSVKIIRSSAWNVKITEPEDLDYMKMWEASLCELD